MVTCDSCEKIGAFVKFPRSIAPGTGGKTKGEEMMCLLQGLLEVGAAIFTGMRHKIDNRPVVLRLRLRRLQREPRLDMGRVVNK